MMASLKMALRPASEDKEVEGRTAHESAALLANSSHPNLPRVYAVGRWPHPGTGYIYFVTEYVEGETFNDWRARVRPTAAQLVDIFLAVVLGVVELHQRQLLHRDLTGSNIVLRKGDTKPYFIDLGSVWLPGSSTLTEKLPPSMVHTLPPECVTFLRRSANEQGSHFSAGEAGDLYQLGVFMFEALTEYHPFSSKLQAPGPGVVRRHRDAGTNQQLGTYRPGPIVSKVVDAESKGPLPEGTLLYGQLWTEGLTKYGKDAVLGRYTEALLPDGRRVPICFILGGNLVGLVTKWEGSKPGEARLPREIGVLSVRIWP